MRHPLLLLSLALALGASMPAIAGPRVPSAHAIKAASLDGYHWQLAQATDRAGQRIAALFVRADKPLQLDFVDGRVRVINGCNAMSGSYRIIKGRLVVGPMIHTMMACPDAALNQLDNQIGARLAGKPAIRLNQKGETRQLQLRTASGDTLIFAGVPTAQTRYGSAGVTEFLEVAPQTVPCNHPLMPAAQCLDVREVHYDAHGLKTGTPGAWQPLQSIEGYTHESGTHNVLRVKRYAIKHPPADAPNTAYVLDMVVESARAGH